MEKNTGPYRPILNHKSTQRDALIALRKLGSPPSNAAPGLHTKIRNALEILAFLKDSVVDNATDRIARQVAADTKANWQTISRWLKVIIEELALPDDDRCTPEEYNRIVNIIPQLVFQSGDFPDQAAFDRLKQVSPFLFPLLSQMWLKLLYTEHENWPQWAGMLEELIYTDPQRNLRVEFAETMASLLAAGTLDFPAISIRRMNKLTNEAYSLRLQRAGFVGLKWLSSLVTIPLAVANFPIYQRLMAVGCVSTFVRVLYTFASRPKTLEPYIEHSPEANAVFLSIRATLEILENTLRGHLPVIEALEAGIIRAMFKAVIHIGDAYDRMWSRGIEKKTMSYQFAQILKAINVFMVHHSVLQRVSSAIGRIEESGLEEELPLDRAFKTFREAWQCFKWKAEELDRIFLHYKGSAPPFCDADECPLKINPPPEEERMWLTYRRCSACYTAIYCSDECGKRNWKSHRAQCKDSVALLKAGRSPLVWDCIDTGFFGAIVTDHVHEHADELRNRWIKDGPPRYQGPSDNDLHRLRFLVYNLDDPEQPDFCLSDLATIVDFQTLASDSRIQPGTKFNKPNADGVLMEIVRIARSVRKYPFTLPIVAFAPAAELTHSERGRPFVMVRTLPHVPYSCGLSDLHHPHHQHHQHHRPKSRKLCQFSRSSWGCGGQRVRKQRRI
ncbi:hypothetical protein Moror_1082 [Moniliophthora roreri MCA 2997]|uniref:MYND-type domain-containing protein n=2 Tax=Moniliophthora roreri TaxID=221103 RepID=V2XK01_MONRO|nr:hypothetical protein Moror_1082 [Moniliophthora roreri MCA 2997]KAI3598529.1 hypothetical protein WG66_017090 [Moniliophthora roreri]